MRLVLVCCLLVLFAGVQADEQLLSDDDIRQILIQRSIAAYSGNCPCPYNRASNGSRCGKRSAYSRPGGASPLCFPNDVSDRMVERYRAARSQ
ncbi:MAG: hypothetical protein AAFX56_18260 [Pseudomonadota bacterium]